MLAGEEEHKKIIFSERYVKLNSKIKHAISRNSAINLITKKYWGHNRFVLKWIGSSLKKSQIRNNYCGYRISRPIKYKNLTLQDHIVIFMLEEEFLLIKK